ncbi:hypothetical protein P691DRAFT_38710 [Macrolepiota fuliginosa MF-IS2]|uniref:Uncharacterized protein n=1 Tax=Macrolepiota fuliginosa MF-IS2 TaxID=1400762 RepID=A0A9P5XCM4_9AGAR|nr:hypothetical protein P691DRAFT_38710 [Macrolepiota fuliginosa MF-IS2]
MLGSRANSARAMGFAGIIIRYVPPIQVSSITGRVPPEILEHVAYVMGGPLGSEDHESRTVKLGGGGYNEVFLISLKDRDRGSQSGEAEGTEMEVEMLAGDGDPQVVGRARIEI